MSPDQGDLPYTDDSSTWCSSRQVLIGHLAWIETALPMDAEIFGSDGRFVRDVRVRSIFQPSFFFVAHDLMTVRDVLAIGDGCLCGVAYVHLLDIAHHSNLLVTDAPRISLLGIMLAPWMLRERRALGSAITNFWLLTANIVSFIALLCALLLAAGFLTHVLVSVPRLWVMLWLASTFATSGRLVLDCRCRAMVRDGLLYDRIAIIGGSPIAEGLRRHIETTSHGGTQIIVVFEEVLAADTADSNSTLPRPTKMVRRDHINRVIIVLPVTNEPRLFETICRLKALEVEVAHYPSLLRLSGCNTRATEVAGVPMLVLTSRPFSEWGLVIKAAEDRLIVFLTIALLAPVMAVIAIAIRLDSHGPVIFRQHCYGWNRSEFQILKLRTMKWVDDVAGGSEVQTVRHDCWVTRIGRLLRKSSLDELPQLFNVLKGTMSLVGPRPHSLVTRTEQCLGEGIIAEYSNRHRVKPSMTGWAQINECRRPMETATKIRRRVEHDIYCIGNWFFLLDLKTLLKTPFTLVFQQENAF